MTQHIFPIYPTTQTIDYAHLGIDEAGRGCLAGPVVAAAVRLSKEHNIQGLNDSKKLSASQRAQLVQEIYAKAQVGIGLVWQKDIDAINILQATFHAMAKAVVAMLKRHAPHEQPFLHIDGNKILPPHVLAQYLPASPLKQEAIVGGDGLVPSIAAASIVAKTHRDRIMEILNKRWPQYNFAKHKGYGTKEHRAAIMQFGACPLHRMTFAPLNTLYPKHPPAPRAHGKL